MVATPEANPKTLCERRVNLAISRVDLAERLGIDTATLWRWETGASAPGRPALIAWSSALDQMARNKARRKKAGP